VVYKSFVSTFCILTSIVPRFGKIGQTFKKLKILLSLTLYSISIILCIFSHKTAYPNVPFVRNITNDMSDSLIEAIDLILEESEIIETIDNVNSSIISSIGTSAMIYSSDTIDTKNIESSILSENMKHNVVEGSLHESDPMSSSLLNKGDERVYSRNEIYELNPIYNENEEPQSEQLSTPLENEALEENTGMDTMKIGTIAMVFSEPVVETSTIPKDNTHFLRKRK